MIPRLCRRLRRCSRALQAAITPNEWRVVVKNADGHRVGSAPPTKTLPSTFRGNPAPPSSATRPLFLRKVSTFGASSARNFRCQISLSLKSACRIDAGVAGFPTITLGPNAEAILETVASSEA